MTIYKISALILPSNFSYGKNLIKEIDTSDAIIYNSSFDSAFQELKNLIKNIEPEYSSDYLRFYIEEIVLDNKNHWNTFEYDQDLNLIFNYNYQNMDKKFLGKETKDCKYQPGDFVEFIKNDQLMAGIISEQPLTPKEIQDKQINNADQYDNCYLILHPSDSSLDTNPHDHTQEHNILGPLRVKMSVKEKILLEERYKKHQEYKKGKI